MQKIISYIQRKKYELLLLALIQHQALVKYGERDFFAKPKVRGD